MSLFEEVEFPRKKGKFWKIIELHNSYKFKLGTIEEYIEIDELLGRGCAFEDNGNGFNFYSLIQKLHDLVPDFTGFEYNDFQLIRIQNRNQGFVLKYREEELDFISDKTLKTLSVIDVFNTLLQPPEPQKSEYIEAYEQPKIDNNDREFGSEEQFSIPANTSAQTIQN